MFEIGRLCVKIAGRDARKKCVVVDVLNDIYVLIDGQTRRRKCNISHLEPLNKLLKIKKGASHSDVVDALNKEDIEVTETKAKQKALKPKKVKKEKQTQSETTEEKAPEVIEQKVEKKQTTRKKTVKKETKKKAKN